MFFQELLKIKELSICNELVDELDKWLAFMPKSEQDIITASNFSNKFNIDYSISEVILNKLKELGILQESFLIVCPECEREIMLVEKEDLLCRLEENNYCIKCDEYIELSTEDVYRCYKLIKKPTASENEIKEYAKNIFDIKSFNEYNFDEKDSLDELIKNENVDVNDFFISPLKRKKKK